MRRVRAKHLPQLRAGDANDLGAARGLRPEALRFSPHQEREQAEDVAFAEVDECTRATLPIVRGLRARIRCDQEEVVGTSPSRKT